MANTPFLDLVKPAGTDRALVSVINSNSDKIDGGVSTLSEQIGNALTAYTITTVSSLDNLKSGLNAVAATLAQNEKKFITFNPSFTAECFKNGIRCYGELHKRTDAIYSFTGVDLDGRTVSFANVNATWKFEQLVTKSDISSSSGGVPVRKAGALSNNGSVQIEISSDFSVNEGFALVALNLSGNGYAGVALLFLGRGTEKKKDILGNMSTSYYSATYSNSVWTITNTSGSAMYYTVILSK